MPAYKYERAIERPDLYNLRPIVSGLKKEPLESAPTCGRSDVSNP